MKKYFKIALGASFAFMLASCAATNPYGGNNYPNTGNNYPNSGVYRTGDGSVYRQGDIYRDGNGNVYQNGRVIRTGDIYGSPGVLQRNGNPMAQQRNLPPGQAKKMYGGRATDYARGQQKKRNRWNNGDNDDGNYNQGDNNDGENNGKRHKNKNQQENDDND